MRRSVYPPFPPPPPPPGRRPGFEPIETERLALRQWQPGDFRTARSWHADPRVMRYLGGPLDEAASDATVRRWRTEVASVGYGMLAVCLRDSADPIGAVGLGHPRFESHFTPCVEIGWRLVAAEWGKGYAAEAAAAVLRDGFARLGLAEVVAFAAAANTRSYQVMARIGMQQAVDGDFTRSMASGGPVERFKLWRIRACDLSRPMSDAESLEDQ